MYIYFHLDCDELRECWWILELFTALVTGKVGYLSERLWRWLLGESFICLNLVKTSANSSTPRSLNQQRHKCSRGERKSETWPKHPQTSSGNIFLRLRWVSLLLKPRLSALKMWLLILAAACSSILIVDATVEEESLATAQLTVVTDEDGRLCSVHKPGQL